MRNSLIFSHFRWFTSVSPSRLHQKPFGKNLVWQPNETPSHQYEPEAIQDALNSTFNFRQVEFIQFHTLELPYFVARTYVGRNLPVYTDSKHGGTKKITIIRRIYGNINVPTMIFTNFHL